MSLRRKYVYGSLLLLLIAGIFFYTCFISKTYTQEVVIPNSMFKTGEQLSNPVNLVKWYLPFAGDETIKKEVAEKKIKTIIAGNYSASISEAASISAIVQSAYKGHVKQFLFTAVSDAADMDICKVTLTYKSTLFDHWTDNGSLEKNARQSLENLKVYMEDTKQFYGYDIERTTVADTSFIFLSVTVPVGEKRTATKNLFEKLMEYAKQKDAGYNGIRIFYAVPYGKEQLMLFASIGVSNRVNTQPGESFQYKKMPLGKNLLVANYQGPYGEVAKAYTALENFKTDHKLSSMAIPYQKFLSDGYDFADEQIVQMKVYYPIF
jgi:effector-binding domain-containing protein